MDANGENIQKNLVTRVQTGVRMEQRLLKVLKALAEYLDLSLGDLLEGVVLHAFENKPAFGEETLRRIVQLKDIYGLELGAEDSHHMIESHTRSDEHHDRHSKGEEG